MLQLKCRKLLLFVYVCITLKKRRENIVRTLTLILLWVFSLAITPWSIFHHHHEVKVVVEKNCTHHFHIKTSAETCLICKAHFEKDYTVASVLPTVYMQSIKLGTPVERVENSYTALISTSLRGPPTIS